MRRLLIMAMAALAVAGCSQNEDADNVISKSEINFNTVVGKSTKAAPMVTADFTKFTVYGYDTEGVLSESTSLSSVFMNGVAATKSGDSWTLAGGPYYWPATGNVQFFAYSPADNVNAYKVGDPTGYPSFSYTIQAAQEDLLTAMVKDKTKSATAVAMPFRHVLTQINFSAQLEADFTYTISKIEIEGVNDAGTYTYTADKGAWTATSGTATYEYAGNFAATATNNVVDFTKADNALMLMPQTLPAGAKINVTYKATATTGNLKTTFDGTKSVDIAGLTWGLGKNIRYVLTLPNDAQAVSFNPTVDNWDGATDSAQSPE